MKIYFDSCIYGRPNDDQNDAEIAAETMAIATIIHTAQANGHYILGSQFVVGELSRIRDATRRADIIGFYADTVTDIVDNGEKARAQVFHAAVVGATDSLHLATAEAAEADYLLTVDGDFAKIATAKKLSKVNVINPLSLISEGKI